MTTAASDDRPTVTLRLDAYMRLYRRSRILAQLEAAGVDNWEGHGEVSYDDVDTACRAERARREAAQHESSHQRLIEADARGRVSLAGLGARPGPYAVTIRADGGVILRPVTIVTTMSSTAQ